MSLSPFAVVAATPDPPMDVLALALAAEFRAIDSDAAVATLDALGAELSRAVAQTSGSPSELAEACRELLAGRYGFAGEREQYDHPDNSMLDLVLAKRRGLPILLSVVYSEVARRAELPIAGVGLPGHFVVGYFGIHPPLLLDPFNGGDTIDTRLPDGLLRPWHPHRSRCECSITSSSPSSGEGISAAPCVPQPCVSRCPRARRSAT